MLSDEDVNFVRKEEDEKGEYQAIYFKTPPLAFNVTIEDVEYLASLYGLKTIPIEG